MGTALCLYGASTRPPACSPTRWHCWPRISQAFKIHKPHVLTGAQPSPLCVYGTQHSTLALTLALTYSPASPARCSGQPGRALAHHATRAARPLLSLALNCRALGWLAGGVQTAGELFPIKYSLADECVPPSN